MDSSARHVVSRVSWSELNFPLDMVRDCLRAFLIEEPLQKWSPAGCKGVRRDVVPCPLVNCIYKLF